MKLFFPSFFAFHIYGKIFRIRETSSEQYERAKPPEYAEVSEMTVSVLFL